MLLGFADPSSHRAYVVGPGGKVDTPRVSSIALTLDGRSAGRYRWASWNRVQWHERRKAGWGAVRRAFRAARQRVPDTGCATRSDGGEFVRPPT